MLLVEGCEKRGALYGVEESCLKGPSVGDGAYYCEGDEEELR